jgi:hypothetical protein
MTWAAIGRAIGVKLWPLAVALGVLGAFALGSAAIGTGWGVLYGGMEWLNTTGHVPVPLILLSPFLVAVLCGLANRQPRYPVAMTEHQDDAGWYTSDWQRDPNNPAHELGTDGYRLELLGGPLAGRTARLRDSRFRLWVVEAADGSHAVTGTVEPPTAVPAGARLLGSYGFSHGDEAMVWRAGD